MKYKMIGSTFDKKSGRSIVTIASQLGQFTGIAICHPEDSPSAIFGGQLAEGRALIQMSKVELKQLKAQLKALTVAYNMISSSAGFNEKSIEARKMRKSLGIKEDQIAACKNRITTLTNMIKEAPKERFIALNKIKGKNN